MDPSPDTTGPTPGCPVGRDERRSAARAPGPPGPALEPGPDGVWRLRGHDLVRQVLRAGDATEQAGFGREALDRSPVTMTPPILYQEGDAHREQRAATARHFTPKATSERYRGLMERLVDEQVAGLERAGRAELDRLAMALAVAVAAEIVGLTDSRLPGMDRRLDAFLSRPASAPSWRPADLLAYLRTQLALLRFHLLDVRPAILARRRRPREDVISHLLELGRSEAEILTECLTFGAAGMVTTREFLVMAAWHLLERPALRARFLEAEERERHAILGEVLRLEPVVRRLRRRATRELSLEHEGRRVVVPAGTVLELDVGAANTDPAVVGAEPCALRPGRPLPRGVQPPVLSFGDGHHRCPGAYVALQETDLFLRRLLALPGLRLERPPEIGWNEVAGGYELRGAWVALAP